MENPILVTRSSMPPLEEYIEEIKSLWDSHWLTNMGPKHIQLTRQLTEYLGVNHLSLFMNGHSALELLIQGMNLSGEVITTPFTFASTTHAIVRNGLTPVFCDINSEDYTIDVTKIEQLITEKTTAILPVHVFGHACNTEAIEGIAKKYNLKIIYDAAHAFGVKVNGQGIGTYGDASMFSFHATKVYNTIEGGAVAYKNEELGSILYELKNFGIKSEVIVDAVGANAKMNEFQAAMGICNLRHIEEEIGKRKIVVEHYRSRLCNIPGLTTRKEKEGLQSNYAFFPVLFNEKLFGHTRDEINDILKENNIYARKYFYPLTNDFECYHDKYDVNKTPVAKQIAEQVLALPLYADLALEDVDHICNLITRGREI